jgi:hypothetical protein
VGYDHETPCEAEPVAGAGHCAFIGQVFGDLLESTTHEAIEGLQNKERLAKPIKKLPGRIAAGKVGQLVREETRPVLASKVVCPFGTADLQSSDAGRKRHRDGCRSAEANGPTQTHGASSASV